MAELSAFQHPRFARMYERISSESEQRGTAEQRDRALAGLSGRGVEGGRRDRRPLWRSTGTRAHGAARAEALPVEDGSVDAAVDSLVLCSVPDVAAALAEIRRVLRPGGELRFFEHVRSEKLWFGLLQD